jgi:hypothetical protein
LFPANNQAGSRCASNPKHQVFRDLQDRVRVLAIVTLALAFANSHIWPKQGQIWAPAFVAKKSPTGLLDGIRAVKQASEVTELTCARISLDLCLGRIGRRFQRKTRLR